MNIDIHDASGVLRIRYDDDTRTYTEWNTQGAQIEQRPYTDAENAGADERTADEAKEANKSTIETAVANALSVNQTIIADADTYLAINNPNNSQIAAQVRDLTLAAKVAANQRNKLARLGLGDFFGTE